MQVERWRVVAVAEARLLTKGTSIRW